MKTIAIAVTILLAGCSAKIPSDSSTTQPSPDQNTVAQTTSQEPTNQVDVAAPDYTPPAAQPVVSMYVEPPLSQPEPIQVDWAPPPMLVDQPTSQPGDNQVWVGGYWVWEGDWVWAHGNWAPPPRQGYQWTNPYYEHRDNSVIFINGFWAAPGTHFVAPAPGITIALAMVGAGVMAGMRPNGPEGVFIPAPPGSYRGLIVPAPIGTSPAVVVGAAPIIRTGMRVTINNQSNVNNVSNVTNITNITNVKNVTVIAPGSAMADGKAVNVSIPSQPHLAAAQSPIVNAPAPQPASSRPIPAYVAGHKPVALPAGAIIQTEVPPALTHTPATESARSPARVVVEPSQRTETARVAPAESAKANEHAQASAQREPETRPAPAVREPQVHQVPAEIRPAPHAEPAPVRVAPPVAVTEPRRVEPTEQPQHTKLIPKKEIKPEEHPETK